MLPRAPAALGLLLLLLLLLLPPPPPGEATKKPTPCKRCRELVDKFNQGMVDTAKKNFGGGNTAWEEKTLSKYEFSEVRLLEIVEGLCGSSDFECNQLVEEHEEHLEAWWLQLVPRRVRAALQREWPLQWRRQQTGGRDLQCHLGYQGPLCTDCTAGYFSALRNATHSVCTACDESCKTCTGPTSRDCSQCEAGWAREDGACVDVDECAAETPPCGDTQYCENVSGSFVCEECDPTCVGCTGKGPGHCKECVPGYAKESGQCTDVDECAHAGGICPRRNENCYNTPGSFVCVCPEGFEEAEDACVQTRPAGDEATEENPAPPPSREDL
ncbi:Cysteine-rich with EGF-like domain protein 2 [Camelus dromedarius]|uniref:protein disulfide-isomerase n=1 Tax=Camelus dromedarius TaxID=9838 RepID=A0A5N4DFV6_CAMDR|nr:Cysteine-rich with EGF-like domain protein 2 [Camelus dromedarius]